MYHIKNDKRSIQSSNWLYNALVELMKENEYSKITITRLVDKAKLGRATFYRNFDSIDDILRLNCDKAFSDLYIFFIEDYRALKLTDKNARFIFFKPFFRYWYKNSLILEQLIKANRIDIISDSFVKMLGLFSLHVDMTNELFSKYKDYFVVSITGLAINILVQWIKDNKNIKPDNLYDIVINQIKNSRDLLIIE